MKCKKCGAEIESKLLYCPKCGESIQLVPEYDVLEEELLSRVVEDKKKAKEDKFATGVYINNNSENTTVVPKHEPLKKKVTFNSKKFILLVGLFLGIAIVGTIIIAYYAGKYSYDNLMNMAIENEDNGQYAKALVYFEEAYEQKSDSFEAMYGLGRMYFKVKEYTNAIEYLNKALELDPANQKIYSYLLESYVALNDTDGIYELAMKAPNDEILQMISQYFVSPPAFSIEGGNYEGSISVELSTNNDYQIFYTTNGKNPVTSGKLYSKAIQLEEGTTEIKAVTLNSEGDYSDVVSETYTISQRELSTPTVTPSGGTFVESTDITIDVPDGCTAYYSWDGSNPVESGIEYTGPFSVIQGSSILSVIIVDEDGNQSPIFRGEYNY